MRGRQRVWAFAQRGASDGQRVDAVGLAAPARLAPSRGRQRAVHSQHPLAVLDQKPLQRARHVPAVLQRPHPFRAEAARRSQQCRWSPSRRTGPSARPAARRSTHTRRRRVRPLVGVRTEHQRQLCPPPPRTSWTPADTACWGRCHAPYLCRDRASSAASAIIGCNGLTGPGGACARLAVRVVCARAPSLISVRDPEWLRAGDMMVDGVIPLG
jgi:hypothetical protein